MKDKKNQTHYREKRHLSAIWWMVIIVSWLVLAGSLFYWQFNTSALPGAKYRYSATACSSSDAECFKYSAQAGAFRAYRATLNRNPDKDGFSYWSNRLRDGASLSSMTSSFIGSSEWRQKYGSISHSSFVQNTYSFALKRNPSQADANYWSNELEQGRRTRGQVAAHFIQTAESANKLHSNFMNYFRPPTPPTPQPTPRITSVRPSPVRGSNSAQRLTINGSGFASNARVTLRNRTTGRTYTNRKITSRSSTRIIISMNFSNRTANWTAQVLNPGGKSSGQKSFRVTARSTPATRPPTQRPTKPKRPATPRVTVTNPNSQPSATGLRITNFKITQIGFRSARLTWKTNRLAQGAVSYGASESNLSSQKRSSERTRDHSITIDDTQTLKAGRQYFVRASSNDGGSTVSVNGKFETKPVSVIITVTNVDGEPVPGASVLAGDQTGETDDNGEVTLNLAEGNATVIAQRDDLYRELETTIEVPLDADTPPQRITLSLGELEEQDSSSEDDEAADTSQTQRRSPIAVIVGVILVLCMIGLGIFLWLKKRKSAENYDYIGGDPLEADNYTAQPPPSQPVETPPDLPPIPDPTYTPLPENAPPRHPTLPELVASQSSPVPTEADIENTPVQPDTSPPVSPAGQPIQQHASLKDLVKVQPDQSDIPYPEQPENDLPVSPVENTTQEPENQSLTEENSTASDDNDTLTIKH